MSHSPYEYDFWWDNEIPYDTCYLEDDEYISPQRFRGDMGIFEGYGEFYDDPHFVGSPDDPQDPDWEEYFEPTLPLQSSHERAGQRPTIRGWHSTRKEWDGHRRRFNQTGADLFNQKLHQRRRLKLIRERERMNID
jgi:hypothetical protein